MSLPDPHHWLISQPGALASCEHLGCTHNAVEQVFTTLFAFEEFNDLSIPHGCHGPGVSISTSDQLLDFVDPSIGEPRACSCSNSLLQLVSIPMHSNEPHLVALSLHPVFVVQVRESTPSLLEHFQCSLHPDPIVGMQSLRDGRIDLLQTSVHPQVPHLLSFVVETLTQ